MRPALLTLGLAHLVACAPSADTDTGTDPVVTVPCATLGGDRDEDGACDAYDNCLTVYNLDQADADADGIGDACDVPAEAIDPCATLGGDVDADEICSAFDNCVTVANADQADEDADGIGDACDAPAPQGDPCATLGGDVDGDGICSAFDNCVTVDNADQADADADGLGDACDAALGADACAGRGHDDDGDQICAAFDNCPDVSNPGQRDGDGDGYGDECDPTPEPCDADGGDTDGDSVCQQFDNCPVVPNALQTDLDGDGVGDVCDPTPPNVPGGGSGGDLCAGLGGDVDFDNFCFIYDNCPDATNPDQADTDGDGLGDACDVETCDGIDNDGNGAVDDGLPDADADGVADCVDLCPSVPNADDDDDGVVDCVDPCPGDPLNDADNDGLCGAVDNCPDVANGSNQADRDGDGIGNVCDVETCDGISNDADSTVDEGMPDEDGDGVCDEIDPCPGSTRNDEDGDGVCFVDDVCPGIADPGQADADLDGWGDACDLFSDTDCSPPAALNPAGSVSWPSNFTLNAVVGGHGATVVYAAMSDTSASFPNRVVAYDVVSGSVAWTLEVGSNPDKLALSDDGSLLYVGLRGAAQVRVVQTGSRRACRSFAIGSSPNYGAYYAGDMEVLPGSPEVLAVSARRSGVSPDFAGVFVFDHGMARPESTPDHTGARVIVAADGDTLYGYNNSSTEYGLRELALTPDGLEQLWNQGGLISGFNVDILYGDGRIFATSGAVVDPVTRGLTGTFPDDGPMVLDLDARRAYVLTSSSQLTSYHIDTYQSAGTTPVASGVSTSGSVFLQLYGTNGLVVGDSNTLHFMARP